MTPDDPNQDYYAVAGINQEMGEGDDEDCEYQSANPPLPPPSPTRPSTTNPLSAAVTETENDEFDLVLRNACRAALQKGLVTSPDDLLVVTAGLPFGTPGAANVIRVVPAAGPACWDGVCRID